MFRKIAILLALVGAGLLGAGSAEAAATTGQLTVIQSVDIAATPEKVWGIIKNFNDMSWHPAIKATSATNGNTPHSVRTLDLGGPKLVEELTSYSDKRHGYSYKITDLPDNVKTLPVTKYTSRISIKKGPQGQGSTVTWSGKFNRADPSPTPADGQDDAAAVKAVTGVYRAGLDNLKKLAETP